MNKLNFPNYIYSLDSSSLINPWRRFYAPDVFPALWKNVEKLISGGKLMACHEVFQELKVGKDDLFKWAKKQKFFFKPLTKNQVEIAKDIMNRFPGLIDSKKTNPDADPFVIALAIEEGCTVITYENGSSNPAKPKIPDVCKQMGVKCINFLDFCREQNWRFR